jgi:hypothetical protein
MMALMVVVTGAGFPYPVMTSDGPDVKTTDPAVEEGDAVAPIAVALGFAIGTAGYAAYDHFIDTRNESALTNAELRTAIAQDAYSMDQTQENYNTDSQNALEITKNDAKQEAYQAYVDARINGSSHSEAVTIAKNHVSDLYTKHQIQNFRKYETQVMEGGGVAQMENQTEDLGYSGDVRIESYTISTDAVSTYNDVNVTYTSSYTLWDTEADNNDGVSIVNDGGVYAFQYPLLNGDNGTFRTFSEGNNVVVPTGVYNTEETIQVYDPDSNSYVNALEVHKYARLNKNITSQHDNVQSTLGNSTSGYLADVDTYYQNNDVTWEELAVDEPSVDNLTTSEGVQYQLGQYHDSPPKGTVVTIETNDSNGNTVTYNGTLYTTWAPSSGSWETGVTYNADQGSTYLYDIDADTLRHVDGDFTIKSIETPDGTDATSISHKNVTLDTSDTSDLKNQVDRLNARLDQLDKEYNSSGGFLGGIFSGTQNGIVIIATIIGAFLLLSNRD